MPGTILVSVLEFIDLPSSKSTSTSIKVAVSLGPKSEFQFWGSRDLSFPLTSLRDNMLVLLQDSEGNQISETAIETRSIVEKGLWDDLFPLKGGGLLHLKLQFVLSEEERIQIRLMREAAVKKKHGEFIHSSTVSVQSTPSVRSNAASSLSLHNVISDKFEETSSAITVKKSVTLSPTEIPPGGFVDNVNIQPLRTSDPAGVIFADEPARALKASKPVIRIRSLSKLQEDENSKLEKQQSPMKRTSSAKNMISAFETGLAEDKKPLVKPSMVKVQSNKNIAALSGNFPKNQHIKEDNKPNAETSGPVSIRLLNSLPAEQLQHGRTSGESGEETMSLGALGGIKSPQARSIKNRSELSHQEVHVNKDKILTDFSATTPETSAKAQERVFDDHKHPTSNMLHVKGDSSHNAVRGEGHQSEITSRNSRKSNIQGAAAQISTSTSNCEDRRNPFESSGGWIFPDEALRYCVTTSSKKVMYFLGSCSLMKPVMHQHEKSLSTTEIAEEDQQDTMDNCNSIEVKDHIPKELQKVHKPEETETNGVAIAQAIKAGIMIGFGALVLLTRQRKNI